MRTFKFSRFALAISAAAALLSACGGASSVPVGAGNTFLGATGLKHHQTFSYTGGEQLFVVPAGVTRLTVIARGGEGTGAFFHGSGHPGFPGRVYAVIRVQPGDKLYVFVAGAGDDGGFNGGGAGGNHGFGGGASDVRVGGDKLKNRVIVAAGGGTSGSADVYCYCDGGNGGGLKGQPGGGYSNSGGGGGTQSAGGSGGAGGKGSYGGENGQAGGNGALGLGGAGGKGGQIIGSGSGRQTGVPGSGGGGGYYGGGGGGGGGGGSSYAEPSAITSRMWTGWEATGKGDGQIIFSWK